MKRLRVSRASARFLRDGHPWVRVDRHTGDLAALRAGDAVTLVDERGRELAGALADPESPICARVFAREPGCDFDPAVAFDDAWERRAGLHADRDTTAYRVVHGEADGLPGLRVERYGDAFVVLALARCALPHAETVAAACEAHRGGATVVIREHCEDLRKAATRSRQLDGRPLDPGAEVAVRELGLDWRAAPFAGLATGIYVDQRGTRRWLRARCRGARVLNCFAYTGLFSCSLLHAGAASAVDVDRAGPCLRTARERAAALGLVDRHRTVKADCRTFLERGDERYEVIVADPPTAARGGGGWVLRRDYPPLLRAAARRLAPGGILVACCNARGKPLDLRHALVDAGLRVLPPDEGPQLEADVPQIEGFPEGRPFRCAVGLAAS